MSALTIDEIICQIDSIHRELGRLSVNQLLGMHSALNTSDIFELFPVPMQRSTILFLRDRYQVEENLQEKARIEQILFGCMDLVVEKQIASLGDMLRFYSERGRMIIGTEKIPALEVVSWLQEQSDFDKREEMQKENSIFLKAVLNPIMQAMIETCNAVVREEFGFRNYALYSQAKKKVSFDDRSKEYEDYLIATDDIYYKWITPWVEEKIGRPFKDLSRYHALYLIRIKRFDGYFPVSKLKPMIKDTFKGLGFDLSSRTDVSLELSNNKVKSPTPMCVGIEIPGDIYVVMKPVGGLIDLETLLHETGHAFFLSQFDPQLPIERRRLYRSPALDETFGFLFTDVLENLTWLETIAEIEPNHALSLANIFRTKKLCLIRRYIGKFLAEKEFFELGDIKNSDSYCRNLHRATGFIYEPQGYLIDMEQDFYALDYLMAWAGAHILRDYLEAEFGQEWFKKADAGIFLKQIAAMGRGRSVEEVTLEYCGRKASLPNFSHYYSVEN